MTVAERYHPCHVLRPQAPSAPWPPAARRCSDARRMGDRAGGSARPQQRPDRRAPRDQSRCREISRPQRRCEARSARSWGLEALGGRAEEQRRLSPRYEQGDCHDDVGASPRSHRPDLAHRARYRRSVRLVRPGAGSQAPVHVRQARVLRPRRHAALLERGRRRGRTGIDSVPARRRHRRRVQRAPRARRRGRTSSHYVVRSAPIAGSSYVSASPRTC